MEFPFEINTVLPEELTKVTNSLLPENYRGNSRECASRISNILDEMGVASAKAQDLKKPITSGEKMRNSDQVVYFLTEAGGKNNLGTVVGLLKIGYKKLYLFDSRGVRHEVQALCILDFYVHESKQRVGCGKILYEYMLKEENIRPEHLAIDRPSDKFIHFLYKHYGLKTILPQANHYVVFDEFFSHPNGTGERAVTVRSAPKVLASYPPLDANGLEADAYNGLQQQGYGRNAASKPICSMGNILHNPTVVQPQKTRRSSLNDNFNNVLDENTNDNEITAGTLIDLDDDALTKNLFLHSRLW